VTPLSRLLSSTHTSRLARFLIYQEHRFSERLPVAFLTYPLGILTNFVENFLVVIGFFVVEGRRTVFGEVVRVARWSGDDRSDEVLLGLESTPSTAQGHGHTHVALVGTVPRDRPRWLCLRDNVSLWWSVLVDWVVFINKQRLVSARLVAQCWLHIPCFLQQSCNVGLSCDPTERLARPVSLGRLVLTNWALTEARLGSYRRNTSLVVTNWGLLLVNPYTFLWWPLPVERLS